MKSEELIRLISESKKKSPIKVFLQCKRNIEFVNCKSFGNEMKILIGDYESIMPQIRQVENEIDEIFIEQSAQHSALELSDLSKFNARIEPGAIIRTEVKIANHAIIMMGAVINIGAEIGENTMIDMNAVIGARAIIKRDCHIGAGAVIAGVIEPPSAQSTIIEESVLVGANAVVLEGIHVGKNSVIAAGSVVVNDVEENTVVAGIPARFIKFKDKKRNDKTQLIESLRNLTK